MIISISFYVVGIACIAWGVLFIARKRARIFYGKNVEGKAAIVSGSILIAVGVAVILFGAFVFPSLVGWSEIREMVPELQ